MKTLLALLLLPALLSAQFSLAPDFGQQGRIRHRFDAYNEAIALRAATSNTFWLLSSTGHADSSDFDWNACLSQHDLSGAALHTFCFDFNGFDRSFPQQLARLADGRLVVAGSAYSQQNPDEQRACWATYAPDGSPLVARQDSFFGLPAVWTDVAVDAQQRILLAGYAYDSDGSLALTPYPVAARFFADGRPDSSFAETGILRFDQATGVLPWRHLVGGFAHAILPLADGGVLLAGAYADGSNNDQPFFLLLHADGSANSALQGSGFVTFTYTAGSNNQIEKMVELPDGSVLFVASSLDFAAQDFYYGTMNWNSNYYNIFNNIDFNGNADSPTDLVLQGNSLSIVGRSRRSEHSQTPAYYADYYALAHFPDYTQLQTYSTQLFAFDSLHQSGGEALLALDSLLVLAGNVYTDSIGRVDMGLLGLRAETALALASPLSAADWAVYPNPIADFFVIENRENAEWIEFWSLQGQCLARTTEARVPPELPSGYYFLRLQGRAGAQRVCVRR